jgi:phospholipase C
MQVRMNRRDALGLIRDLTGATALSRLLSGCGDNSGGITTYVFLMLENRSYDQMLGARSLLEARPGDGVRSTMFNRDRNGVPVAVYPSPVDALCVLDPPHDWDACHAQWNGGTNDNFLAQYQVAYPNMPTDVMAYLTRSMLPVTYALADAYTSCDRWFASVMGPTMPNRAYWMTGTSFGLKANDEIIAKFDSIQVPTIFNRLAARGIDWGYYAWSPTVYSQLGNPGPYQLDIAGKIRPFATDLARPDDPDGQFFRDAAAGVLPPVVYIDPYFSKNDDHPPGHPIMGQALIAATYRALASSPQWQNCLLVVTYDEHGGFFDHVPPPTTTDDTLATFGVSGFDQLGFRVPALVIGPYAKQGHVSSVQHEHTSALKQLQVMFGLEPLTARVDAANDLLDCIDLDRLAKGRWAPPIEIPAIDLSSYPMAFDDPACKSPS